MEPRREPGTTWRGWVDRGAPEARSVTSGRLPSSAKPRNRLFPKTRSWFALDAPLELLSPLSVLRVFFALATVAFPILGLAATWSAVDTAGILAVSVATAVIWIVLLRVKAVDVRACRLLVAYWTAAVAALVWMSHDGASTWAFVLFMVPISVFTALFLGHRAVVAQLGGSLVLLWAALTPGVGVGRGVWLSLLGGVALLFAPVTVLFLGRSARRHDMVDPDTGLPNGFGLAQQLADHDRTTFLVAAVALDGIDAAREALGYQVGTELLRRAVEDLGQVLPSDAVIGRVAGDELVVTLGLDHPGAEASAPPPGPGDLHALPDEVMNSGQALADTLVGAISTGRYLVGDVEVSLRAHVGMTACPWGGRNVTELMRRASLSASRALEGGLSLMRWDGDQGALTADDLTVLGDLRAAIDRRELSLAYQPQVVPGTSLPRTVEALLRWDSPKHGRVPPSRFITLAERAGLIDRLTTWVIVEALDAQARWRRAGVDLPVSVNLSAKSLSFPGLAPWILSQLADRNIPASCLTIEVTETAVADPARAVEVLLPLHEFGVRISIDDFGTGFTSLAALPTLPVDELKVDQCFVLRSTTSPADEAIVRTVAELAHRLGLEVVAEGVETEEIAALLETMAFDLFQGFHFARPMPEADLLRYLGKPGTAEDGLQVRAVPTVRRRSAV
jgi:EAL domain-containing protein (putative c-di-GMP-specific phosphodiesterase class I)/GGDEF domain-containing protein